MEQVELRADAGELRRMLHVLIGQSVRWPIRAGYFSDRLTYSDASGESPRFNGARLSCADNEDTAPMVTTARINPSTGLLRMAS